MSDAAGGTGGDGTRMMMEQAVRSAEPAVPGAGADREREVARIEEAINETLERIMVADGAGECSPMLWKLRGPGREELMDWWWNRLGKRFAGQVMSLIDLENEWNPELRVHEGGKAAEDKKE